MSLVTSEQLRAGRAMVRMGQERLAELAGVHTNTVTRIEQAEGPVSARTDTVRRLQRALEGAGVEFLPGGGVRLRDQPAEAS